MESQWILRGVNENSIWPLLCSHILSNIIIFYVVSLHFDQMPSSRVTSDSDPIIPPAEQGLDWSILEDLQRKL